ncbi:MAG: hypothetical protein DRP97_07980, partial [Candidatus Latescibacterota bacterium]
VSAEDYASAQGRVYVYISGAGTSPQVVLNGSPNSEFGRALAAGDFNGDGCDDLLAGAPSHSGTRGGAFLYLSSPMDTVPDLTVVGLSPGYEIGSGLGMGDLNGDGCSDAAIGGWSYGNTRGVVYIYYGSAAVDSVRDMTLYGGASGDYFGDRIAFGDLNGDGYEDMAVASYGYASGTGKVSVFTGSAQPDSTADYVLYGTAQGEEFGYALAVGDVNGDGTLDLCVGSDASDSFRGRVSVFYGTGVQPGTVINGTVTGGMLGSAVGVMDCGYTVVGAPGEAGGDGTGHIYSMTRVSITVDGSLVYSSAGTAFSDTVVFDLDNISTDHMDTWGTWFGYVNITLSTTNTASITLSSLEVLYDYRAHVELGEVAQLLSQGEDVVLNVEASGGTVVIDNISVEMDAAPEIHLKNITVDEESETRLSLDGIATDDRCSVKVWTEDVVPQGLQAVVSDGMLVVRSTEVNWSGEGSMVLRAVDCAGNSNSTTVAVEVRNINDPPVITSTPDTECEVGVEWSYTVAAEDGDGDALFYQMPEGPEGMYINAEVLRWTPEASQIGVHTVRVSVSDGTAAVYQEFQLTVSGEVPEFLSSPPGEGLEGHVYSYRVEASTGDLSLVEGPEGAVLEGDTLLWTPGAEGRYRFSLSLEYQGLRVYQNFTVSVGPNSLPVITGLEDASIVEGEVFSRALEVQDPDGDGVNLTLAEAPEGMQISGSLLVWETGPGDAGVHEVVVRASDGIGSLDAVFNITVRPGKSHVQPDGSGGTPAGTGWYIYAGAACGSAAVLAALLYMRRRMRNNKNIKY